MVVKKIVILLHEELDGFGVLFSVEGRKGKLLGVSWHKVIDLSQEKPDLSVYNDHTAESLIRQELQELLSPVSVDQAVLMIRQGSEIKRMALKST